MIDAAKMKNLGGTMPDGSHVPDFWINKADFICESGVLLSSAQSNDLLGKLCLTKKCLIMLPYDGAAVQIALKLADYLRKMILGPYAEAADNLKKIGLYAQAHPEILKKVLIWPLSSIQQVRVNERNFLFIKGGADLIIQFNDENYTFNMATKGYEPNGFACAQDFMAQINRL